MTPDQAPRPNFFLVGAAKCGTTSLYEYLRQHPQVFMSQVKEPYFFGRDLAIAPYWKVSDEAAYLRLFADAGSAARIGEGSVWYLYSTTAPAEIKRFDPSAKIIIMVRNPVDVLYSLHGQFLRSYNENIESFEEALEAEPDRRAGRRIPRSAHFAKGLLYREVVCFHQQIKRYLDVFGREAVHLIVFDDLKTDPASVYRQTLEFLGIDSGHEPSFGRHNEYRPIVIRPSRRFWKQHPQLECHVDRVFGHRVRGGINTVWDWFGRTLDRPARMSPTQRAALLAALAPEIEQLSGLIGRDLSARTQMHRSPGA